jgi:hypothetical protein
MEMKTRKKKKIIKTLQEYSPNEKVLMTCGRPENQFRRRAETFVGCAVTVGIITGSQTFSLSIQTHCWAKPAVET